MRKRDIKADEKARKAFSSSPTVVDQDDWESKFSQQLNTVSTPPMALPDKPNQRKSFSIHGQYSKLSKEEAKGNDDMIWDTKETAEMSMEFREAYNFWKWKKTIGVLNEI